VLLAAALFLVGASPTLQRAALAAGVSLVAMIGRVTFALRAELRVRKDLYLAVAERVERADVMHPLALPGGEAEGALVDAVYGGTRVFAGALPSLCGDAFVGAVSAVIAAAVLPSWLAWLALFAFALVVLMAAILSRGAVRAQALHVDNLLSVHEAFTEVLERRHELAAMGEGKLACAELSRRLVEGEHRAGVARAMASLGSRAPAVIVVALFVLLWALIPLLLERAQAIAGSSRLLLMVLGPVAADVSRGALELRRAKPELAVLQRLLALPQQERGGSRPLDGPPKNVTMRDVTFGYQPEAAVLQGVSLDWANGSILALAGANGGGKSTVLKLLLGFARPPSGKILIDGTDMFDFDLGTFREHVAYVSQRPALPKRSTVRVLLAAVEGGDAGALLALENVGFPPGTPLSILDTTVAMLSAGQAQRVALARAFASSRRLLVLDEPDANLDERSVACLARCLRAMRHDRSIVLAAHHPTLLGAADRVVVLGGGA
jgi:ABC-type bacteriocin/lantibiotic exporter with double-glycine peptidase domain